MGDQVDEEVASGLGILVVGMVAAAASVTFSLNCWLNLALKPLLDAFKNLQIIVHIMLIDLYSVAHCETFFGYLLLVTNMEIYDPSEHFVENLPVVENDALNMHFEETGYEYSDSILSMGSVLIIAVLLLVALPIMLLLSILCCWSKPRQFFKVQLQKTFLNRIITFIDSSLLVIATCACINIYQV